MEVMGEIFDDVPRIRKGKRQGDRDGSRQGWGTSEAGALGGQQSARLRTATDLTPCYIWTSHSQLLHRIEFSSLSLRHFSFHTKANVLPGSTFFVQTFLC